MRKGTVIRMGETTPSESEWLIMEVIWQTGQSMTAAQIIERLKGTLDVSAKTVRVMINRLVAKGMLSYTIDPQDARIYHYEAARSRQECLEIKSGRFVKNYFGGGCFHGGSKLLAILPYHQKTAWRAEGACGADGEREVTEYVALGDAVRRA